MPYQVKTTPEAHKEIKALSGYVRAPALAIIEHLGQEPRPAFAKELRGKPSVYRIRFVNNWRLVYRLHDDDQVVVVLRVRRKEDIDYDNL